ncbi:MAG TPA: hypothetical protein VL242_05695 [Sorangium sp.]|nr:hypothetical protein [Sorangium sp.]
MSKKGGYTPNDQRSIVKNPGTPAYEADRANRIKEGHPGVPPPAPAPTSAPMPSPAPKE